jgi:predicted AAA+ superfamily ATPase
LEPLLIRALQPAAPRKVICLFGPRQSGKTTLMAEILKRLPGKAAVLNGDFADDRARLAPDRAALQRVAAHLDYFGH